MLEPLGRFARQKQLAEADALRVLRGLFLLTFGAQALVAFLLSLLLRLLAGPQGPAHPSLSQSLTLLAALNLPFALFLSLAALQKPSRQAALYAALLAGVLLSSPAWFLAFALLVGSEAIYLSLLLALLVASYAAGFLLCARFARAASSQAPADAEDS